MKKILLILGGLLVTAVIAIVIVISQIDVSEYKEQALVEVEKATGRKVSIEGDLDLSISLTPAIVAEGIRFANADWGSRADMATIKRIEVQVALLPLISGEIEIQRFILIEPDVLLEKNAAGKGNWEIATATTGQEEVSEGEMTAIDIGTVHVKQLKLVYRDAASEKPTEFSIDTLKLDSVESDQLELELKASLDGTSIDVNGKIGSLDRLFDNKDYPVDITANIGAATSTLKGSISEPFQGKGLKLLTSLNISRLDEMNSLTGAELPAIGPFSLTSSLSDPNGAYKLADLKLKLDETSLSGEITANVKGKVPYIKANLHSPMLNLVPFQPEPPEQEVKVERYLTDDLLPLEGLANANALKLDDGRLNIKPLSMALANGTLSGDVSLDASQKTAGVSVNLTGKNIQLGQLEQLKETLSGGSTNLTIRFSGKGNSSQTIASGANGKLLVQVGAAEMKREEEKGGFLASIGKLLNPFSAKDNAMLDCAVLNFNIKDGIRNEGGWHPGES